MNGIDEIKLNMIQMIFQCEQAYLLTLQPFLVTKCCLLCVNFWSL